MAERIRKQRDNIENLTVPSGQVTIQSKPAAAGWQVASLGLMPYAFIALAVLLWLVSLPFVDPREMTDIGLLSVMPPFFYIGLLVLTASFFLVVFQQPLRTRALLLHLVALVAMIHATPAILYGTLRYSWAWKHVGMVDYIQRFGSVDHDIPTLTAYQNWPGFFALNAMFTEAAGLESALSYASWGPLFFNLLFIGGLLMVYRALTSDLRIIWTATWIFFLANWVGQDYFAPQSFAFFFYLVLIGILLGWFRTITPLQELEVRRWLRHPGLTRRYHAITDNASSSAIVQLSTPRQRLLLMGVVILLMITLTYSHQLTPLMVIGALFLLVIFQVIYPRGLLLLMAVMTAAWIWFAAAGFMGGNLRSVISSFGELRGNVAEGLINLELASAGQVLVAIMGRGLTLLVLLLAGLGVFRRLHNGYLDLSAILLAIAPFFFLLGNAYGGEILFRVYLFSLPFLVFFVTGLILPKPEAGRQWTSAAASIGLSVILLVGFLFAYYGKENQYYYTPDEVAASEYLFDTAPPGAMIVEGTRNYPTLFRNYEQYFYVSIAREPEDSREEIVDDPVAELSRWMENTDFPEAYLIITRSMKAEVDTVGSMPHGSLAEIETALRGSDLFEVLYDNPDATIFILRNRER